MKTKVLSLSFAGVLMLATIPGSLALAQKQAQPTSEQMAVRARFSALAAKATFKGIVELAEQLFPKVVKPSNLWEQIRACGFYPQETRLECIVQINQRSGYGGPIGSFGSFEYVYFCVDWDNDGVFDTSPTLGSVESVGQGNVHMHDESARQRPPWHYAVYRDIDVPGGLRTNLGGATTTTVTNGPTRRARAILSWLYAPTNCNYVPIWGDIHNFRIRFDPIR